MPKDEEMTIDERRKYLRLIKKRYLKASKLERGRLLDEMEVVTGLHRKSLIRLISGSLERIPRCKQRGRTYSPEVDDALRLFITPLRHFLYTPIWARATVLTAFLPNLTMTIPPDPPETTISGVFLGIQLFVRPVLTRSKSPWRYVHTYTWRIVA